MALDAYNAHALLASISVTIDHQLIAMFQRLALVDTRLCCSLRCWCCCCWRDDRLD